MTTTNEAQTAAQQKNNTATLNAMSARLARIESRLTQLMLFQGMQTDGRSQIVARGGCNVG